MRLVTFQSKKSSSMFVVALILLLIVCLLVFTALTLRNDQEPFYHSKIAYADEDGLYIADFSGGAPSLLVGGKNISFPLFSRDGSALAFLQDGDLYGYDMKSSKKILLLPKALSYAGASGGQFFASSAESGLQLINVSTAKSTAVLPPESGKSYQTLSLSPSGKLLAYSVSLSDSTGFVSSGGVYVFNLASKKSTLAAEGTKSTDTEIGHSPIPGKWSPDSRTLFLWLSSAASSISADGVHYGLYDVKTKKLTPSEDFALMYNENVSFSAKKTFTILSGTDRILYNSKKIQLVDYRSGLVAKTLPTQGLAPATPFLTPDETRLLFSGVPEDYRTFLSSQIYLLLNGKRHQLTSDAAYGSLLPQFLKNNNFILFTRATTDGKYSIWRMNSDGKNQVQIAQWSYSNPLDPRGADYFGRLDWSRMFSLFDNTKPKITLKSP